MADRKFKDLAKEKTKLKLDTFCALSECSLVQGLQTPPRADFQS